MEKQHERYQYVLIPLRSGQDYERPGFTLELLPQVLIPLRSGQDYEQLLVTRRSHPGCLNPFEIRAGLRDNTLINNVVAAAVLIPLRSGQDYESCYRTPRPYYVS